MFLKLLFIHCFLVLLTHGAFLNKNRFNVSSALTLYYRIDDSSDIYFTFYMTNNIGWIGMGFGSTQTNTDMIQVYMDGTVPAANDLWSQGDFNYASDTSLGGVNDIKSVTGSRINGVLNLTVSRPMKTGDQYDYEIVNDTTLKCIFLWSNTDTTTTKYINNPASLNIYFTTAQVCHTVCNSNSMTCSGPDISDCTCPSGSYFNASNNTCFKCLDNCDKCLDQNSCTSCKETFIYQANPLQCTLCTDKNQYNNGTDCTICDLNCGSCGSETRCDECASGFYLTSTDKCSACVANCSKCTTASNCNNCILGFYLSGSTCQVCPSNCQNCTDSTTCLQCAENFYFLGSTCVACNSSGQLRSTDTDGTGTCIACVANCANCLTQTTCSLCADGYLVSSDTKICNGCTVSSCKQCNPVGICNECLSGYNLILNTCQKCEVANCISCDSGNPLKCASCNSSYNLFNGICSLCSVENCAYCSNGDTVNCVYCADGYYLNENGTCQQGIVSSCLVPWGQSSCVSCDSGFNLYQNSNCVQCSVTNCQNCTSNNICNKCNNKYLLQDNVCLKCIANCDTCSSLSLCSTCSAGYYLNSKNECAKCSVTNCQNCNSDPNSCSECLGNNTLSSDKSTCFACSANCQKCSNASVCTSCQPGYYLDSSNACTKCAIANCQNCSSATKCDQCISEYTPNSDGTVCSICPFKTCKNCNSDYECNTCRPEFYFNNVSNSCISCKSNCLNCVNNTICSECSTGHFLSNKDCVACAKNCAQCNQTSCISCYSGYGMNENGECISCNVTNCLKCSSNNICSQCSPGFSLDNVNNICGCSSSQLWDSTLKQCLSCNSLYTNCNSCSSTVCLSCQAGYFKTGATGTCSICNQDTNCNVCSSTNCLSCISGYYLLPNNTCTSCFEDCSNCTGSANNQCTSCNSGFSLLSTTNQCATSKCPTGISNCQSCVRDNTGKLGCAQCKNNYFWNSDTKVCDFCHPSCLTCSGKAATNCLSCPSYSLFYSQTGMCIFNCSSSCLTCDGNNDSNCLSCGKNMILLNKSCVSNIQAFQNISSFNASAVGISSQVVIYAIAIRSFTEKTANILSSCSNNNDCFNNINNNGECYESNCICSKGFLGKQCQISESELFEAIKKKNEIIDYFMQTLTSSNLSRILQNTTSQNLSGINSDTLAITLSALVELSTPIELWNSSSSINSTVFLLNQLLENNLNLLNQSIITLGLQALSNMVYILNNFNFSLVNISRVDQIALYKLITKTIPIVLNTTLSSLTSVGNSYQIYTPHYMVALSYLDLSSSLSTKYTLFSTQYYDVNDVYMTELSFSAQTKNFITQINSGNYFVILKQSAWINANPFPEDKEVQNNLTLATGISSIEIYKTSGNYIQISGLSNEIAIRIKKLNPSSTIDTANTLTRYACAYWDNSTSLWSLNGINNDETTESQNYIGCYTNHLTDFSVVYRNKTNFFALEFVEVILMFFQIF